MKMAASDFRSHLRKADDPRIAGIEQLDARGWAQRMLAHPRAGPLLAGWRQTYLESEFRGVTTDGRLREGLFLPEEQAAPAAAMLQAVGHLLPLLDGDEQAQLRYPLDAREWRGWLNPEAYLHPFGLRLEEVRPAVREAILAVLQASLSAQGYQRARDLMRINHFLGELVNGPRVMNEYSYNFCLFGDPSATAPWGWSFFRPPSGAELPGGGRATGADAGVHGGRAELHRCRAACGHASVRRGGAAGPGTDAGTAA